jgi:hypothetical protein
LLLQFLRCYNCDDEDILPEAMITLKCCSQDVCRECIRKTAATGRSDCLYCNKPWNSEQLAELGIEIGVRPPDDYFDEQLLPSFDPVFEPIFYENTSDVAELTAQLEIPCQVCKKMQDGTGRLHQGKCSGCRTKQREDTRAASAAGRAAAVRLASCFSELSCARFPFQRQRLEGGSGSGSGSGFSPAPPVCLLADQASLFFLHDSYAFVFCFSVLRPSRVPAVAAAAVLLLACRFLRLLSKTREPAAAAAAFLPQPVAPAKRLRCRGPRSGCQRRARRCDCLASLRACQFGTYVLCSCHRAASGRTRLLFRCPLGAKLMPLLQAPLDDEHDEQQFENWGGMGMDMGRYRVSAVWLLSTRRIAAHLLTVQIGLF